MNWTERQSAAIEKKKKTLLVSAAAGSGKTAVLVERIKRLLIDDEAEIDRMLVVTFTNAAAGEMKEKISKMLSEALKDGGASDEKKAFLRRQSRLMRKASISTFHSFALELIKKYYHIIGTAPNMSVCDAEKEAILQKAAMDELFEDSFDAGDPDFLDFLDHYSSPGSDKGVKNMILNFHVFLQSLPDPEAWKSDAASGDLFRPELFKAYAASLAFEGTNLAERYFRECLALLERGAGVPLKKLAAKAWEDLRFAASSAELVKSSLSGKTLSEGELKALSSPSWARMSASADEKAGYGLVKDAVTALRKKAKISYAEAADLLVSASDEALSEEKAKLLPYMRELCTLTTEFEKRYSEKKKKLRVLDFSDIEHFALKILENEEVREECRSFFDYIFIDEYQDSNRVQEELIKRICREDNVFMVGDVKQSIYKFRLAEPEIFLEKYKAFKSQGTPPGEVIDLNSNFRSKAPVIDFVNGLFEPLMTEENCGMVYDKDAALSEGAPYEGEALYDPKFFLISCRDVQASGEDSLDCSEDSEIEELKADEAEAAFCAAQLKKYLGKPVYDSKQGKLRPLKYGDMAILMRSVKSHGEVFYKILTDEGIPVYLDRSEGYFDVFEIQVFLNLLRLIDNGRRDVPLISVLRFPSFGFSASDLSAIRIYADGVHPKDDTHKRLSYSEAFALYASEGPDGNLQKKSADFLQKLSFWRLKASCTPLGDFLWDLLSESGIRDMAAAMPSGEQRRANLNALVDKALQYGKSEYGGLYGFINYIELINKKGWKVESGQAGLFREDSDAVRIMTVHKSKGLEFPLVYAAGLGRKFVRRSGDWELAMDRELGISMRLHDPEHMIYSKPLSLKLIKTKKKYEELAESIRVLYVALTRAKDILLMSAAVKDAEAFLEKAGLMLPGDAAGAGSYLDMIYPILGRGKVDVIYPAAIRTGISRRFEREEELKKALSEGFEDIDAAEEEALRKVMEYPYFSGEASSEKRKYSVSQLAAMEREGLKTPRRRLVREGEEELSEEESSKPEKRRELPLFFGGEKKLTAAEKGTAYHTVMEHIPFRPEGCDADEVRSFIAQLRGEFILTEAEASAVDPEKIAAFFSSEIGQRALRSDEIHKEAPFVLKKEYMGRNIMVQGTIDCYFKEGDSYVLVDYKSSYIGKKNAAEELQKLKSAYLPQLRLYREALENITGVKVKEGVLYLFSNGEELRIE